MTKTITETIEGLQVECTRFDPFTLYELNARLLRVLGPALVNVLVPLVANDDLETALSNADASLLGQAFAQLAPTEVVALSADLLRGTTVITKGQRLDLVSRESINVAFDEAPGAMLLVLWMALKHNASAFFGGVSRKLPKDVKTLGKKRQAVKA